MSTGEGAAVVLLSSHVVAPARQARVVQAAAAAGLVLTVLPAETTEPQVLRAQLEAAGLLLVDVPDARLLAQAGARFGEVVRASARPYVLMGEFAAVAAGRPVAAAPLQAEQGVARAWAQRLREYWRYGGAQNLTQAMAALRDQTRDLAGLPPAQAVPVAGLYHPRWPALQADTAALAQLPRPVQDGGATVAIAVNRAVFTADDTAWLDALMAALEARGLGAYAFYGPIQQADLYARMSQVTALDGPRRVPDLLINAAFVFRPAERQADLERLGVPVLQLLPSLERDAAQWARSRDGLAPDDVARYYTGSEYAGMIDPMLVAARDQRSGAMVAVPAQIAAVADKAAALIRLQRTTAAQRRVAVMVYNYPLGEGNFGASFLNVPRSLGNILAAMREGGYRTEAPAEAELTAQVRATLSAPYLPQTVRELPAQGLADVLPLSRYLAWFRSLPLEVQQRIEAHWGAPERALMLRPDLVAKADGRREPGFVIPRVQYGQVVVLPQPLRHEVTASTPAELRRRRIGHRSAVPLSHSYLATYLWLREQFGAHALVHLGTHGTQEWAPGKDRALSVTDDPMLALGDLPNVYPYIMDNLGEALTAKRRGRAVMVSHATPMFSPAGFRPGVQTMHDLMHDWETVAPGPVRRSVEAQLVDEFVKHGFDRDLGWSAHRIRADFAGFMERLHPHLDDLAQTAQPLGLAVFGEVPDAQRRFGMILQILRKPLIEALGEDIDEVFLLDADKLMLSRPARWLKVALQDPHAAAQLDLRAEDARLGAHSPVPNRAAAKVLDPAALLPLAQRARELDALLARNEEIAGLLRALDGRHLGASYGGDPVRNPESLPTGRNLYGFDPARVPTRQAWETGVAAFDAWLNSYRAEHGGRWPEKVAYTLWAGETLRHQGVMEAQALYALGMRPRWDKAGRLAGLERLSALELQRPRIDIVLSVTGSYRDQFPLVMRWLDQAVQEVAQLDEPGNAVARHSSQLAREFAARGLPAAQARRWASARVFSNESGVYGAGLNQAVLATDTWREARAGGGDAQLAALYLDRLGHAQGEGLSDAGGASQRGPGDVYARNLTQVDAALLPRSSNTYGVLTSDDAFQYLGGIALAVRRLTGREPALYVQNLRDPGEVRTDSAALSVAKEMQTRYLHPQWIRAQQGEGYSGTLQVLKAAQFLWGWQVTSPQAVRADHWQSLHDVYLRDRYQLGTRAWLERDNRAAFAQTLERLLDAVRLGYWQADTATRRELRQAYREALRAGALRAPHPAVRRYVLGQAAPGRGALPPKPALAAPRVAEAPTPAPTVRGLQLLPQTAAAAVTTQTPPSGMLAALLAALLVAGAWRQSRRLAGRAAHRPGAAW